MIDSRDVVATLAWLDPKEDPDEYAIWKEFADQGEEFTDWGYGEVFIADAYFVDYARELAEDIGAIDPDASWPLGCIDWDKAADQLRADYSAIEVDGHTYWARS